MGYQAYDYKYGTQMPMQPYQMYPQYPQSVAMPVYHYPPVQEPAHWGN